MRAIAIDDYTGPPTLHADLPVPQPAEGEIVVRIGASSVNGFDIAVAHGRLKGVMEHRFPVVLGRDYAGTVETVGLGVEHLAPGDEVLGVVMGSILGQGTFGEYVAAPAAFAARRPDGLDVETAGGIGLAAATALNSLDAAMPSKGETVLISGATGGVGAHAVQLAAARGARVIATAGPGEEAKFVRDLGASDAVDHHGDLTAAVRSLSADGVDAVIHLAGDAVMLAALCKPGGRIASTIGLTAEQTGRDDIHVTAVMAMPTTATLEQLAAAVVDGTLRVPVQRTYELEATPQALEDFAGSKRGKLVIRID
ncbi:MAG TPA: NADP-dependent oxidoreductase [Acidimicrobiales bacterium]